jgi:hypothetical protein
MRRVEQEPTHVVTFRWVMRQRTFALGVARMWATLAPRDLPLRRNGKINPDAVMWFARHTGIGNII